MNSFFLSEKMSLKLFGVYKYGQRNDSNIEKLLFAISHINLYHKDSFTATKQLMDIENKTHKSYYSEILSTHNELNEKHIEKQKKNIDKARAFKLSNGISFKNDVSYVYSMIKPLSSLKISDASLGYIINKIKEQNVGESSICDLFLLFFNTLSNIEIETEHFTKIDKTAYVFFLSMKPYLKTVIINYNTKIEKNKIKNTKETQKEVEEPKKETSRRVIKSVVGMKQERES